MVHIGIALVGDLQEVASIVHRGVATGGSHVAAPASLRGQGQFSSLGSRQPANQGPRGRKRAAMGAADDAPEGPAAAAPMAAGDDAPGRAGSEAAAPMAVDAGSAPMNSFMATQMPDWWASWERQDGMKGEMGGGRAPHKK